VYVHVRERKRERERGRERERVCACVVFELLLYHRKTSIITHFELRRYTFTCLSFPIDLFLIVYVHFIVPVVLFLLLFFLVGFLFFIGFVIRPFR